MNGLLKSIILKKVIKIVIKNVLHKLTPYKTFRNEYSFWLSVVDVKASEIKCELIQLINLNIVKIKVFSIKII